MVLMLAVAASVWFLRTGSAPSEPSPHGRETTRRTKGNSGPWGELEYIPILIETPDEFLSVSRQVTNHLDWKFHNYSVSGLVELLDAAGLSRQEREWLLDQRNWQPITNGFAIAPSPEMLMGLNRAAREHIYAALAECGGNPLHESPLSFRRDGLDDWFYKSGLSAPTIALTKSLLYQRGNAWCLTDWPLLLRYTDSPAERRRLLKTTSRQATLLTRLRIQPDSNLDPLITYWGRGGRSKDIRALLESLTLVDGGATLDIVHLLPRFVRARIYTYPFPNDSVAKPAPNCFWTAMNFFSNQEPGTRFFDPEVMRKVIEKDYYPVEANYLLGDVLLLTRADGLMVHAASFIADDVVLTKNGAGHTQPWMLTRVDDLAASYPAVKPLKLRVFRRKDL
jgi:hypothetical protein